MIFFHELIVFMSMKKYTKLNQAIKMTGLTNHVLRTLSGRDLLRFKTMTSGHRRYRTKDLRKISECCKHTGAKTCKQITKALLTFKPYEKHDIVWLRVSDKTFPKMKAQAVEILKYCKDKDLTLESQVVIKEKGSENKPNRRAPEKIIDEVESGTVDRIFCWDRTRLYRGSAVQWVEAHCKKHNVELIIVEDLTGKYTERLKRELDRKNEMERFRNKHIHSEIMKGFSHDRKLRRQAMDKHVPTMERMAKNGDVKAAIYLEQFVVRRYDNKPFMDDFLKKAISGI